MIKILYTDDESSLLDIAKLFLEKSGEFSVTTALSVPEAIRLLEQEKFDAIISDYQMPEMDGIQFLVEVRSRFGPIPFILFTGRGREEIVIQAINSGADFYLQKGGEPKAQFAELTHKIKSAASRKKGEDALRRSEEKFRMIVENSHDIIYTLTAEGEFIFVSPAWTALLGHPVTQVIGQSFTKFVHPDDISPCLLFLKSVIETGEQQEGIEYRVLHINGVWDWHTSSAVPIKDETGTIIGFYGIARDITERKRAEKALKEQLDSLAENERVLQLNEKRLLMAQEIGRTGCWEYNVQTDTIWGSAEAHRIFGLSHDAGEIPLDEFESCIQERERVHQTLVDLINAGKEYDLEFVINPADGSAQKVIHSIARIEKDAEGKPLRVVGVIQDITRRKQGDIFRQLSTDVLGILSETAELREVIVRVLNAIKQVTNADAVGVRLKTDDDFPYFVENGFSNDFLLKENTLVARDQDGGICRDSEGEVSLECTCGLVISGKTDPDKPLFTPGGSIWTNNSFPFLKLPEKDDPRFHPRNTCIHEGYASVALIPIRKNQQQIIGILQINAYKNDCFTPEIIQSLEQIAGHIGEALMRKQAEKSMRESEEKLAAIVAGSPVPKFVIDKDHKIIYWNRALEQTTGISAAQVMGTKNQWRAFYDKERPTMADLILDEAFTHISEYYAGKFCESPLVTGAFEATDFFPHMGEKGTYLRFMAAPIKNLHGDILGAVETLIDVSDIKRAEVELRAKNEELGAAFEEITATEEELRANLDELSSQELSLRESKKELSDIIEFLPDATFAINTKGVVIAWNHAMEVMTGVKPADILTKGNYEYSLPFYRERRPLLIDLVMGYDEQVAKKYPGIKKEGDKLIAEVYIPHLHNGRGAHLWFTSSPLYDSRGQISGAIESIREITEHKERESALNLKNEELGAAFEEITATEEELRQQVEEIANAQEALREAEKRYRNIVEDQTEFICRFLPDGTHVFVNDAYCRYFGVPREDIIGHTFSPVLFADDKKAVAAFFAALTEEKPVGTIDQRIIMPDGTIRWQRWSDRAIFDDKGNVVEYQSVGRDITEQKRSEEAQHESEKNYRYLIENANEAIIVAQDGLLKFANPMMATLTGYSAEELTTLPYIEIIHPDDRVIVRDRHQQRILGEKISSRYMFRINTKDNITRWVESSVVNIDWKGRPATLNFLIDISTRRRAEDVLLETEERYRNIVEDQTEFICRFLPDGTHVFVNDAYCRYFGVAREVILGHKFSPVLYADDQKAVAAFFATLTPEKPIGTIDHRIIMPDGTIRWQRWSDRAIFDDKGNVVEYQSVGRDITEHKEVEAQLQTASKEYQKLLENITDVYYRSDAQGRLILASQSWATLLDYPDMSECIGKNIAGDFYANPEDRSQFLKTVYQNGYVTDYEITLKKKDGTPVTVATSSYLYFDAAGHVLGVEGTFRDISERKRITEVLKETEQRLTDIISFLPDATFAIDSEGKVIAWNHAIEELTGVPAGDMIGKGNFEYALPFYGVRRPILIDLIDTPDAELETNYSSVRRHGKILTAETGMAHVGGTNRILWGKASPLYNFRNEVVGAIESIRDFTEQRILEDSLKQVNKKLNLMSSITRHDVSNNITVCLGYLELSKYKSPNPDMQKLIDILEKNIGAIQSQINFTRVYQDLGVAAPVWQDLGGLLRECSSAGKIPVIYDITNLQIYADPLISKVFYNLYDNAVRHGERVTEIHVRAQERGRDMVIIWEDDGVGVLQNEKEKIFNRGFGKNTGLGLFLVREILGITGMSILENGETGKGARFEILLPSGSYRCTSKKVPDKAGADAQKNNPDGGTGHGK